MTIRGRRRVARTGMARRFLLASFLVGAALASVVGTASATPAAPNGPTATTAPTTTTVPGTGTGASANGSAAYDALASCVANTGRLLVVLLVDESGSLQGTDPKNVRVAAAKTALSGLSQLTNSSSGAAHVDVLVSAFSNRFKTVGAWTPLTAGTLPSLQGEVDTLAARNTGMDTDFTLALSGARDALAAQAVAVDQRRAGTCKAVLMFTDGKYDLGVRTTPAQRKQYGDTKPYAPKLVLTDEASVKAAEALGATALCAKGGVADQLRADQISTLTVALATALRPADQDFLQAITSGKGGDQSCGKRSGARTGVFLPAANLNALIGTFDAVATRIAGGSPAGTDTPLAACTARCVTKGRSFTIDGSLRRIHLFVITPSPASRIELQAPGAATPLELKDRRPSTVPYGGGSVSVAWPSSEAATIDIVPQAGSAGPWSVSLVDPAHAKALGSAQEYTFSDVVATLQNLTQVQVGTATTLHARVGTRQTGKAVTNLREATIVAVVTDPVHGTVDQVSFAPDPKHKDYTASYTPSPSITSSVLEVVLKLDATTRDGIDLRSTSPQQRVPVRKPRGYPAIAPDELVFSSVSGKHAAKATLQVLSAGLKTEPGCFWVGAPVVTASPPGAGPLAFAVDGAGRAQGACLHSPLSGTLPVTLKLTPHSRVSGSVRGYLRVFTMPAKGQALPTDIPFSFETTKGVDQTKQVLLFLALLLLGIGLPVVLLYGMNLYSTRFQAVEFVQAANLPVLVRPRTGEILRHSTIGAPAGPPAEPLHLYGADFTQLDASKDPKRFAFAGLRFSAHTPVNPFAPSYATASPEGGAEVAREGRKVNLALSLSGSWIFLYDPAATEDSAATVGHHSTSAPDDVYGNLVAFVARGPVPPQAERLVNDIFRRLPKTARRLTEVERASRAAAAPKGSLAGPAKGRRAKTPKPIKVPGPTSPPKPTKAKEPKAPKPPKEPKA